MDEQRLVAIAGNLIDRVSANRARMQMIQDFQFLVQFQLFIEQLHQLLKTACAHMASPIFNVFASEIQIEIRTFNVLRFAFDACVPCLCYSIAFRFQDQLAKVPNPRWVSLAKPRFVLLPIGRSLLLYDQNSRGISVLPEKPPGISRFPARWAHVAEHSGFRSARIVSAA